MKHLNLVCRNRKSRGLALQYVLSLAVGIGLAMGGVPVQAAVNPVLRPTTPPPSLQPRIDKITPESGTVNSTVTIVGANLSTSSAVLFNGVATSDLRVTSTSISVRVPEGAGSGPLTLVTDKGDVKSSTHFEVVAPTQINTFSPLSGPPGTRVTILGSNLSGATGVRFNGMSTAIAVRLPDSLIVTVPAGAASGKVAVQAPGVVVRSTRDFEVTAPATEPVVTGYSPSSASVGQAVTLSGRNFNAVRGVKFGAVPAQFVIQSASSLVAYVPVGAVSSAISVSTATQPSIYVGNFTLVAGSLSISGRVATASGAGLTGVKVLRSGSSTPVVTDSNGNYVMRGVLRGSFTITASAPGLIVSPATKSVSVGTQSLSNINFLGAPQTQTFSVTGRTLTASGAAVAGAQVSLNNRIVVSDVNGNFKFAGVTAGSYTATARKSGFSVTPASRAVTVAANHSNVNFIFTPQIVAPANNDFARATIVTAARGRFTGTNTGATRQSGEPSHAGSNAGASVWFKWTAPDSGTATFDTAGSVFDTVLAVYSGTAVNALTIITYNDDARSGDKTSRIAFVAVKGRVYYIAADAYDGGTGNYVLNFNLVTASATPTPAPTNAPAPPNDRFSAPAPIAGSFGGTTGRNTGATIEAGEPDHSNSGRGGRHSVWYKWIAPASGVVSFSTRGSDYDTVMSAYTGTSVSALQRLAANDDASSTDGFSRIAFNAFKGTTYLIAIDGYRDDNNIESQGNVTLGWVLSVRPANDDLVNAQLLSGSSGKVVGNNANATRQTNEPQRGAGFTVWYKWRAPSTGAVVWNTSGSPLDTYLGIYTGTEVGSLQEVASNDNVNNNDLSSRILFSAEQGTTYFVAVDGYSGPGNFVLNWAFVPRSPNDNWAAAKVLSGLSGQVSGNNLADTNESGDSNHIQVGGTVWFKWTAPSSGTATFSTAGSNFDTGLSVSTGLRVDILQNITSNNDVSDSNKTSLVTFVPVKGTTYSIMVGGHNDVRGDYKLSWNMVPGPANDDVLNAHVLTGNLGTLNGTNRNATMETGEPRPQPGVWYRFTAPTDGLLRINTLGSNFDTEIHLYIGTPFSNSSNVGGNDNADPNTLQSALDYRVSAGATYYLGVVGHSVGGVSPVGDIVLNYEFVLPSANDNFANAVDLGNAAGQITGRNHGDSREIGEDYYAGMYAGFYAYPERTIWFRLTPSQSGTLNLSTQGSNFPTVLNVFTGQLVGGLTSVQYQTDIAGNASLSMTVRRGVTYQIQLGAGHDTSGKQTSGNYVFNWNFVPGPANDDFANAQELNLPTGQVPGTNANATQEDGEPASEPSVWYKFTPTATGFININTRGSNFDTVVRVYTGNRIDSVSEVASNDDYNASIAEVFSDFGLRVSAGTTYYLRINGTASKGATAVGNIVLNYEFFLPSPNDNYANAIALGSVSGKITGRNFADTTDAIEPPYSAERNVWYTFTPSQSGIFNVSTQGSNFSTRVSVYTGQLVGVLNVEGTAADGENSSISVNVGSGVTYRIQMGGVNDGKGSYVFNWSFVPSATTTSLNRTSTLNMSAASTVKLSSAILSGNSVQLRFSAPLNSTVASDVKRYQVMDGSQLFTVENAKYLSSTNTVVLTLAPDIGRGQTVAIKWNNLRDAQGLVVSGQTALQAK